MLTDSLLEMKQCRTAVPHCSAPGLVDLSPPTRRHRRVATVTQIVSDRIIKVTHANWSRINGAKGQVERDVTVVDASEKGDWSAVKVWFDPIKSVGIKAYPTYGFIYGKGDAPKVDVAAVVSDSGDDEVLGL